MPCNRRLLLDWFIDEVACCSNTRARTVVKQTNVLNTHTTMPIYDFHAIKITAATMVCVVCLNAYYICLKVVPVICYDSSSHQLEPSQINSLLGNVALGLCLYLALESPQLYPTCMSFVPHPLSQVACILVLPW